MLWDIIVDIFGMITIALLLVAIFCGLSEYVKKVLKKQTKIKCLCKHEYEPFMAVYYNGIEYDFKCRKCGKVISIKTVTDDKFNWVNNI